ncbi:MAG: hypothetical protein K9L02_05345 [Acholeplasmataceae bacterium]|nr:hypothetical protein [Acholeplasmataceae bacterium]
MKKKAILISMYLVTLLSLLYTIGSLIVGSVLIGLFNKDYSNPDDYTTETIIIGSIDYGADYICLESNDVDQYQQFMLEGSNYDFVINNDIESTLSVGDQIMITYGPKGFGDSFDYPIVMLEKASTTLLDYETGFNNLNEISELVQKSFYSSLMVPLGALFLSLSGSIYITIRYIKSNK